MATVEFKDIAVGDIFDDGGVCFRKISTNEVVEMGEALASGPLQFTVGEAGDVLEDQFEDDYEVDTVDDAKKIKLLNAHKAYLQDLANLFGVIL